MDRIVRETVEKRIKESEAFLREAERMDAEGKPDAIRTNPAVLEAYLGGVE